MPKNYILSCKVQDILSKIFEHATTTSPLNQVTLTTNLVRGLPEKDIHKLAGPLTDEWVYQVLSLISQNPDNEYGIYNVESKESSSLEDVRIHIKGIDVPILIDVKSASLEKGTNAGKGSNLTSFRKIRPHYVENPDSIFIVLSIKNAPLRDCSGNRLGFSMIAFNVFDIKLVAPKQLLLNKAMGDQFQISNSLKVTQVERTTSEFIDMIDTKFIEKYSADILAELIKNNYVTPKKSKK